MNIKSKSEVVSVVLHVLLALICISSDLQVKILVGITTSSFSATSVNEEFTLSKILCLYMKSSIDRLCVCVVVFPVVYFHTFHKDLLPKLCTN